MKRVLFVDDDQQVLDGLQNMFRKQRNVWEMSFALGGAKALAQLGQQQIDVIVSDIRMPGMDGPTLLAQVKDQYPTTARIVLSGHVAQSDILRAVPVSHQYLSKPCDADSLRIVIERACDLRNILQDEAIRGVIGHIDRLPSVPRTYTELTRLAGDPKCSIDDMARTIEQDPAMSIKILQLGNSAYFGLARQLTSIPQAVMYLGIELVRGLALSAQVLARMEKEPGVEGFSLERFQQSSLLTAQLARSFLSDKRLAEEAFTAGLVHDIGKFIVALAAPEKFAAIVASLRASGRSFHAVEREQLGVTHAEVGAYLLGTWGLPLSIVEAVAHHHQPGLVPAEGREVLAAVHAADALIDSSCFVDASASSGDAIDVDFIERAGLAARLPEWRKLALQRLARLTEGKA